RRRRRARHRDQSAERLVARAGVQAARDRGDRRTPGAASGARRRPGPARHGLRAASVGPRVRVDAVDRRGHQGHRVAGHRRRARARRGTGARAVRARLRRLGRGPARGRDRGERVAVGAGRPHGAVRNAVRAALGRGVCAARHRYPPDRKLCGSRVAARSVDTKPRRSRHPEVPVADSERDVILAFDFGLRRLGVATANLTTRTASPLTTLNAGGGVPWAELDRIVAEWRPSRFVVGMPGGGPDTPLAKRARGFARALTERYGIPTDTTDETLKRGRAANRVRT